MPAYLAAPAAYTGATSPVASASALLTSPVIKNTIIPAPYIYSLIPQRAPVGSPI